MGLINKNTILVKYNAKYVVVLNEATLPHTHDNRSEKPNLWQQLQKIGKLRENYH